MKNTDILNRIMTMLSTKVELKQMTLKDGSVIECSTYEVGSDVFKIDGENKEPLEVGEYIMEDGSKFIVTETGKIGEMVSAEIDEEEMKKAKEEMGKSEDEEKMAQVPATIEEIVQSVMDAVMPLINDLQAKIEAMSGIETEMKEVKEKLSSQIVSKPTIHKPTEEVELKSAQNNPQALIFARLANIQK
jgi:hypothetical protein